MLAPPGLTWFIADRIFFSTCANHKTEENAWPKTWPTQNRWPDLSRLDFSRTRIYVDRNFCPDCTQPGLYVFHKGDPAVRHFQISNFKWDSGGTIWFQFQFKSAEINWQTIPQFVDILDTKSTSPRTMHTCERFWEVPCLHVHLVITYLSVCVHI